MPEALELVGRMLERCFPHIKSPPAYVGNIAALLLEFPKSIAVRCMDSTKGVARTCDFPPKVVDIVKFCEADAAFMQRVAERERRSREQLAERDRDEHAGKSESAGHRARVVERIRKEMAAAGMPLAQDRQHYHGETPATVKAKYGISDERWDAIEDGPKSTWQKTFGR